MTQSPNYLITQSPPWWGRLMRVSGHSMTPTLNPGELVLVHGRAFAQRVPLRGEIVAARPGCLGGRAFVKRLVGLPHEQVEFEGERWQLGEDEFFLLGDRPTHSLDSRLIGPVSRQELIGPVWARVWPWRVLGRTTTQEGNDGQTAEVP